MKIYTYNGKRNICGDNVKEYRTKMNLTQSQLAIKMQVLGIDIDRIGITKIENGNRLCMDFELLGFSKIFDLPIESLIK